MFIPGGEWFSLHFSVVRHEKITTIVRIVFDVSATYEGKSLNIESLPGPKLQSQIFDILVVFCKETVAIVGDIIQMYHQLVLTPKNSAFHKFLWLRYCNQMKEFQVYKFSRIIFGGCYCSFWYTWQMQAECHKYDYPLAADAIKFETLLDDLLLSVLTVEEVQETRIQLSGLRDQQNFIFALNGYRIGLKISKIFQWPIEHPKSISTRVIFPQLKNLGYYGLQEKTLCFFVVKERALT